jgi:Protein phosphatase 2C
MNTNSEVRAATAAVAGAHHRRTGRNGQDAAAAWTGVVPGAVPGAVTGMAPGAVPGMAPGVAAGAVAGAAAGAVVVCDGCSAGGSSEVGARLGAELVIAAAARELLRGARPTEIWPAVQEHVLGALDRLVSAMPGDRARVVREHLLFTIVAAAYRGDEVAVWAVGDGAYAFGDRACVLGPFPDNQPPYLAYALLGAAAPAPRPHTELADARCGSVLVATDGAAEVGLGAFGDSGRYLKHPDALRRHLALLARGDERIDWDGRRVERRAAALQDDGAVALLSWSLQPRPQPQPQSPQRPQSPPQPPSAPGAAS